MRMISLAAGLLAGLFVLVAPGFGQELVNNPAFENWSQFKVGASVTLKQTLTDRSGDSPDAIDATGKPTEAVESFITFKLITKTPEKIVVEKTVTDLEFGNLVESAPVKISYPAKIDKKYVSQGMGKDKVGKFKEGEESLDVGGKKIACHWVESEIKVDMEVSYSKVWAASDAVPGGTVKVVTTKAQGNKVFFESTLTVVEIKTP